MFKKKPAKQPVVEPVSSDEPPAPKYQHPKILVIDTAPEIAKALSKEGYNISIGTFGTPYKVQKSSGFEPVVVKASLPKYTEQEIIIVDLVPSEPEPGPPGEKMTPMEEDDWWAKCSSGEIDPRPRAMLMVQNEMERIHNNGGVFIVFADSRVRQEMIYAHRYGGYRGGLSEGHDLPFDNWSFLSLFSNLTISLDHGEEIQAIRGETPIDKLVADHLDDAAFCCTFEAQWHLNERWVPLAKNKYGAEVAGIIVPPEKTKTGWVLVLLRIKEKARFLSALLKNILPDLCPGLFPHAEGQRWVHRTEYELPSVLEKAKQINAIQEEAALKVTALEAAIEADRNASAFLYALIRETGDPLVEAIKRALALIGFKSVIDVDEEMTRENKDAALREDLRIHDKSPVLVVDIKGVAGKPADAEVLQAQKHAFIYIQEQNRADFRGLTIINHQRLLPPLDRDNDMPFRKEILANAEQVKLGLMTGWDLFRIVRGFIHNNWKPDYVIPLFYQVGRILPIPQHYEYIGKVKQVWRSALVSRSRKGRFKWGKAFRWSFQSISMNRS